MSYYAGKKVLLVGGSEGIGREAALGLVRAGAHVMVAARRQGPLDEALQAMKALAKPDQLLFALSLDATNREAVREAVAPMLDKLGGIDVIITNVGSARVGYVHELDDAAFDAMIATNYVAHANVVRAFLPTLIAQKHGDICFVSSALGFMSMPGYSAYSASKFAVAGFAEALSIELAPHGIRVSVFYPGTTDTPGLAAENADKPKAVWTMESDSAFSKTHKPEAVAERLLSSVARGKFENFPGMDIWFVWWMYKRLPGFSRWMAHAEWRKALAKVAKADATA